MPSEQIHQAQAEAGTCRRKKELETASLKPVNWYRRAAAIYRSWWVIDSEDTALLQAQYRALKRQIPLSYLILLVNTWAVVWRCIGHVPAWLCLYFPVLLTALSVYRLSRWMMFRRTHLSPRQIADELARTRSLAVLLCLIITVWGFSLFRHAEANTQFVIVLYLAVTLLGCTICLMHVRPAAIVPGIVGTFAYIIYFAILGQPDFLAISVNVLVVSFVTMAMLLGNYRDFTELIATQSRTQALSNENKRLAHLDPLTNLPNRRYFFSRLHEEFQNATENSEPLAVGLLDLDGFKPINDLYGHPVGDELLCQAGKRICRIWGNRGHLARIGGDEFAIVIARPDTKELLEMGERTCAALQAPFVLSCATVRISASIGFATFPDMSDDVKTLYEQADYALYQTKRVGRGRATLFTADQEREMHRDTRIEQCLYQANLEQELTVHFQPIVDLAVRRAVAFEALARWNSPELGRVSPGQFIPIAERSGYITSLTKVLLRKSLDAACRWSGDVRLSVNLSTADIGSPETVADVIAVIRKSGFDPKRLDVEITETAMFQDFERAHEAIDQLRALGCGVSLDDFGVGYSNFRQLHLLPLTTIKIDRSFVEEIHRRPNSYRIVRSLLALGRDMSVRCVVEGVETEEEMRALHSLGCQLVQGYLFAPPLSEKDALHCQRHDSGFAADIMMSAAPPTVQLSETQVVRAASFGRGVA